MMDLITVAGVLIALTIMAVLVPCCPLSVICPPFCVCTLPLMMMLTTTIGGLMAYWTAGVPSLSGMMGGGTGGSGIPSLSGGGFKP